MTFSEKLLSTLLHFPPRVFNSLATSKQWALVLATNPQLPDEQWSHLWANSDPDVRTLLVARPLTPAQQVTAAAHGFTDPQALKLFVERNSLCHEALMAISGAALPVAVEKILISSYRNDAKFHRAQYEYFSPEAKLLALGQANSAFGDDFLVTQLASVSEWYPKEDHQRLFSSYPLLERALWHRPAVVTTLATKRQLYFGVARAVAASRFLTDPTLQLRMAGLVEGDQPCEPSASVQAAMEANPYVAPEVREAIHANPHRGFGSFYRYRSHDVEGLTSLSSLTVEQAKSLIATGEYAAQSIYVKKPEHVAVDAQLMFELAHLPLVHENKSLALPMLRWLKGNYSLFDLADYNAVCARLADTLGERWSPRTWTGRVNYPGSVQDKTWPEWNDEFATMTTSQVMMHFTGSLGPYLERELGAEPFTWEMFLSQVDMKTDSSTPFTSVVNVAKRLGRLAAQ